MSVINILMKVFFTLGCLFGMIIFSYAQTLVPYNCGDKWGYADETGKPVLPCRYTRVDEFINGRAVVLTDEGYTIIDTKGRALKKPVNCFLMKLISEKYAIQIDRELHILRYTNDEWKELPPVPDLQIPNARALPFYASGDKIWFQVNVQGERNNRNLMALFDAINNQWLVKGIVEGVIMDISTFNSVINVNIRGWEVTNRKKLFLFLKKRKWLIVEQEGKKGVWSYDGEEVIPTQYDEIDFELRKEGDYYWRQVFVRKGGYVGIYDTDKKKEVLPCEYVQIRTLSKEEYAPDNYLVFTHKSGFAWFIYLNRRMKTCVLVKHYLRQREPRLSWRFQES